MKGITSILTLGLIIQSMAWLTACNAEKEPETPPNIVWITSEDNSVHYMQLFDENGAPTPRIASLAEEGLLFTHAFSNAPVCSAARSTLISGCYGPRTGSHFHRKMKIVPMPEGVEMFPAYLRSAGYHTTNNRKEDYNFIKEVDVWDESSRNAHWRSRAPGQPFFHVRNFTTTHESSLHFTEEEMAAYQPRTDPESFYIHPMHPQTGLFRYTNAYYRDRIMMMDTLVGTVLDELKEDGLMENTFVFYFGDHGGVLPGSKGFAYETGLHIPLVVYIPEAYREKVDAIPGSKVNGFVSFVDLGANVLNLAGIDIPDGMDGKPFLGEGVGSNELASRETAYGYADRFDEKYDLVRTVRKGKYKYIRNYQPFNFDGLRNNYRYRMLAYRQWLEMYQNGELNDVQSFFFETRPVEQLFDLSQDPFETVNLAGEPAHAEKLQEMRTELNGWIRGMPDLSFYPESYLIAHAFNNPVAFGQAHRSRIHRYQEIADLSLLPFEEARQDIRDALIAGDPWERYWACIVASCFGLKADELSGMIRGMAAGDPENLVRVRAAEFLGLTGLGDPVPILREAIYRTGSGPEALLILNTIVLMRDGKPGYDIPLETGKIKLVVREHPLVQRRLQYLGLMEAT